MDITMAQVARDFETDGVPPTGPHKIKKSDLRKWGKWVEDIITAFTSNGGLVYSSKAAMDADLAHAANSMAWVIGDPVAANNGIYGKVGASGTGSWARRADLPYSFAVGSDVGAGTANAIQITTDIPVSDEMIVAFSLFEDTTGAPVTVSVNGGSPLTVKTNRGNSASALTAGMDIWFRIHGSEARMLNDQDVSALVAQAEAAAAAAAAAAQYVSGFETLAAAEATSPGDEVKYLQILGRNSYGDGGAFKAVEVTEDGSPLGPGQFRTNVNLKRWENAENIVTPAMFSDITEMFAFTKAEMRIPAGNYEFDGLVTVRDNAVIRCEEGAVFIPTFSPALNYIQYPEEFDNAYWSKGNASVTANQATAPDGTPYADLLVEDSAAAVQHYVSRVSPGFSENTVYTFSVHAKPAGRDIIALVVTTKANGSLRAYFNVSTGSLLSVTAGATAGIENIGDGWYRPWISWNSGSGATADRLTINLSPANGTLTYTGDGVSGAYLWGAQAEAGSSPTFYRAAPYIDMGDGCSLNRFGVQLDAGINTVRTLLQLGSNTQCDYLDIVSADLNNNRTAGGDSDTVSGALLIRGSHVRIGQLNLSRFDRGWAVVNSVDILIGKVRNLETLQGGYAHGTRDLHVLSGYTSGPSDPTLPNAIGRGIMTPGLNSLLLAGCSDSSFSNWITHDILEHAVRLGRVAAATSVPNWRVSFNNCQHYRPYGTAHKQDDGDDANIKRILINGLIAEDVGHGNWFGDPGFVNWAPGDPNNDNNKAGVAIRNSEWVTVLGFENRANVYPKSSQFGAWFERSSQIQMHGFDIDNARDAGILISNNGVNIDNIQIKSGRVSGNDVGLAYRPGSNHIAGAINISGLTAVGNTTLDIDIQARPDAASPFSGERSRIEGNAAKVTIAGVITADGDISSNIFIGTGRTVYNPPSLADGASVTTTVTVVGAVVNDRVTVTFGDTQGVTIYAWVSAADTVSVRFQNNTGAAVDIAQSAIVAQVYR